MSKEKGNQNGRNPDGTFKKGEYEGGPGRPEGSTKKDLTEAVRTALSKRVDHTDPNSHTKRTQLVETILEMAIEDKDQQMIKEVWRQLGGKPKQKTDITSDGERITFTVAKEIADKNEIDNE